MSLSTTDRAYYRYTVKETQHGHPWIMCELADGEDLPITGNWFLGFDLPEGTTMPGAEAIARFMNAHLRTMKLTRMTPSQEAPDPEDTGADA